MSQTLNYQTAPRMKIINLRFLFRICVHTRYVYLRSQVVYLYLSDLFT